MGKNVGFMCAVMSGVEPREAWTMIRDMVSGEEELQKLVRQLAATEGGRELLDDSRRGWGEYGLSAPFDFVLEEGE